MNKKTLNTICFIVSVVLFVWGFIITAANMRTSFLSIIIVGVTYMVIGAAGFLYVLTLFNKNNQDDE
ncbi:hypothetical protein [Haloplasma contractile]|uniref:Uncharacterized protein n=1 Tax=Haloplasma contractile SSD-17B TaxID=1033810 RepID=F7PSB0_9MOLU|nr:hypothetical protein [Haloplasma contractile]ERJ10901.1 hypothetical protein HLPCO_003100 [Haloplasma contractile SSD-17B]